jgi:hypothetical protein
LVSEWGRARHVARGQGRSGGFEPLGFLAENVQPMLDPLLQLREVHDPDCTEPRRCLNVR